MIPDHQSKQQQDKVAELQEKLATQEVLAGLGLAWIALQHRLNNTVNLLLPQVKELKIQIGRDNRDTLETVKTLERNINQLTAILSRLDLLIPRETKLEPQDVNTLLYEVTQELVSMLIGDAVTKDIVVNYHLSDEMPPIKTDVGLLKEVFRNLTENSLKAMESGGGKLEISTRYWPKVGQVEIEIKDTGCGIPPNIRDKLFLRPIEKLPTSGTGLGLWLSKLLLDRLGGTIQVARTRVDNGTTMVVTLSIVS